MSGDTPRRLHFVLGKGGVGKSTLGAALALAARRRGARVLAIELGAPGGLSRSLGDELPGPGTIVEAPSGVALVWFDGAAALTEYLGRVVRLGPVLDKVFAHPLYRAFVDAAPGLKELMAMGKVRDEFSLHKEHGRPHWDVVVVDAGASGHAIEHLRMPAAAAETFHSGRVHRESQRVHALFADPAQTAIWVVATPEEMPLREAAESVERLAEAGLDGARVVVNRCRPVAPDGVDAALAGIEALPAGDAARSAARDGLLLAARRALGWQRIQEQGIAALVEEIGTRPLRLPILTEVTGPGLAELGELLWAMA